MLEKIKRPFHLVMASLNVLGTLWIVAITLLITADVTGRAFFNAPIFGVPEIVKISVVGIVWLQMSYTLKINGHLRSHIIIDRINPRLREFCHLFTYLLGLIMFALIIYSGWDTMIDAWVDGEFEGEAPVRVPTYPIRSIVLLGAFLTSVQFLFLFVDSLKRLVNAKGVDKKTDMRGER